MEHKTPTGNKPEGPTSTYARSGSIGKECFRHSEHLPAVCVESEKEGQILCVDGQPAYSQGVVGLDDAQQGLVGNSRVVLFE